MTPPELPTDKEAFADYAEDVYNRRVVPRLRPEDDGKYVALDVVTAEYEVDEDDHAAVQRLLDRHPEARGRGWLARAGYPTAYRFAGGGR